MLYFAVTLFSVTKYLTRATYGFNLGSRFEFQFITAGKAWWQECDFKHRQEAESKDCQCSVPFLLWIQSKVSAHGTMLPTLRANLLTSISPVQKLSYRYA